MLACEQTHTHEKCTDHVGCLSLNKQKTQTLKATYCPLLCKAGRVGNICVTGI